NTSGLATAVASRTVTARATANDGSGIYGQLVITISGQVIPVTGITVTGAGGSSTISSDNGQLQLSAAFFLNNTTNNKITWSIINGTGQATINTSGLVTAVASGTVTARATANDGSGVYGQLVITISGQVILVTGITVTGAGGATTISQDNGTLALTATVSPSDATNKSVTWSIINGTGQATINSSGVVTAVSNGTVTARATANDGSGIYGQLIITISGQSVPVTKINVAAAKGEPVISTDNGTLQLSVTIAPTNATNQTVTWSVINGTGEASVNATGLVTAIANGTVVVRATANDGSGVFGELAISIVNQVVLATGITIAGEGGVTTISTNDGTLKLVATVVPTNATNKSVTWSLFNGGGHAELSEDGVLTARSNGKVGVRAMANDGSNIYGQIEITITNQIVSVASIKVKVKTKSSNTTTVNGELELTADIFPEDATEKNVAWSVKNGTGEAIISDDGILTGVAPGEVTVVASSLDGSGVTGELAITINLVESIKIWHNRYEIIIQVPDQIIPAKASLHNLYGSHIETRVIDTTECIFDISGLMPGVYIVSVYNAIVQDAAKIMIPY
ncbi:MAG: Ig-like domain-containing protein, partial [Bacteroidales bacterium]|nr:Ig-like domain-containing protein [Bacteroidales bacterium]